MSVKLPDRIIQYNVPLTEMQKRFVKEYTLCWNATEAAIRAGYSKKTANVQADKIMKNVAVRRELGKAQARLYKQYEQDLDVVIEKVLHSLTTEPTDYMDDKGNMKLPHELPDRAKSAVESVKMKKHVTKQGDIIEELEYKVVPKSAAMEMALKIRGHYAPEQVEQTTKLQVDLTQLYGKAEINDLIEQELDVIETEAKEFENE
jgi:phage terminase small subunit